MGDASYKIYIRMERLEAHHVATDELAEGFYDHFFHAPIVHVARDEGNHRSQEYIGLAFPVNMLDDVGLAEACLTAKSFNDGLV